MKKRILSILLVVAMMIPMCIMPTNAVETASTWNWEGMFEKYDIRNVGQPKFNVGSAETTGVVVDGKIDANDNYTEEKVLVNTEISDGKLSGSVTNPYGAPDITVRLARKDAYLYISFQMIESTANHNKSRIQLGMNIYNGPTIANSVTRAETHLYSENNGGIAAYKSVSTFGENGNYSTAANYSGTARDSGYTANYVVEYKKNWVADTTNTSIGISTYEAKIDLALLSLMTTTSKYKPNQDTEANMVGLMFYYYENGSNYARYFWHNVSSKWNNANNPYKDQMTADEFVKALKQQAYGKVTSWGGATTEGTMFPIAFGGETISLVGQNKQEPLGAVGTDVRNIEEGHVINIPSVSAVAPVVDGVIGENEYTVKNKVMEFKTDSNQSYSTASFAYKDGYIYLAVVTTEAVATNTQIDMNAMPVYSKNANITMYRTGNPVQANGDLNTNVREFGPFATANSYASVAQMTSIQGAEYRAEGNYVHVVDAANKSNGVDQTVYEYKISAALLAEYWGKMYNVPSGITIFGINIWTHGVTIQSCMNDSGMKERKTVAQVNSWGNDWGLYTIQTPEATDAHLAAHKAAHQKKLNMVNGASARISASPVSSGLRFKSTFTADYIADITSAAAGQQITVGTLIAPADYVAAAGAFTMEALDAKYGAGNGYVKVVADLENAYSVDGSGNVTIAGSITNIRDCNIQRDFVALAFVQYGDTVLYAKNRVVRNIYEIIDAAVKDTKTAADTTNGYVNEVEPGVFSQYSANDYAKLNTQLATYDAKISGQ